MIVREIYQDRAKGWRWRAKALNNRILADSGEAYTRRSDAVRAWGRFAGAMQRRDWMQAEPFVKPTLKPLRQRAREFVEACAPADATAAKKKRAVDRVVRKFSRKRPRRKGSRVT